MKKLIISYVGAGNFSRREAHDIPDASRGVSHDEFSNKVQHPQNYSLPKTFYQRYPDWDSLKIKLGLVR